MTTFFERIQALDRRWIYLALIVTLVVSLIYGRPIDPVVLPSVQQFYDTVAAAPAGEGQEKLILVNTIFSGSTIGESGNQARAIIRHLMLSRKRFAVMAVSEPQGAMLGKTITQDLAKHYGYRYGVDWIDFDYQVGTLAFFKAFPKNIPGTVKVDGIEHKPLTAFPIMRGIRTIDDVAMLVEVTASASVFDWIQIVQPTSNPRLIIGYACTGVMAAEAYPYLDSGQLVGMMPGLKGAADYEKLVDDLEREVRGGQQLFDPEKMGAVGMASSARELMFTQGAAHLLIIFFIVLGNVGLVLARRRIRAPKEDV
jgi:hypothetical protein